MSDEAYALTIREAGRALREGRLTSVALTESVLGRIAALQPALNAYLCVTSELALEQAALADQELASGRDRGPLQGIPMAFKDLIDTAGVTTTGGSKYLRDRVPKADAFVVAQLKRAGMVMTGKLGLSNYFGSTSVEPPFGLISNPWNREHEPGSSSGGSGAAVASGMCLGSLGTDSGGSVRTPASMCGLVGLKPTFGLVSRRGVLPLAPTLDTVGVLARTVEDSAVILDAIAARDPDDPTCVSGKRAAYTSGLEQGIDGVRVGVPRNPLWDGCEAEVAAACEAALVELEGLGATVEEVSLPRLAALPEMNEWAVMTAETSSTYADLIAMDPDDLPPALRLGMSVPAVTYINAQRERRRVMEEMAAALGSVDVLVSPTNAVAAPARMRSDEADAVRRRVSRLPSRFNVTGNPAVTMPCGFTSTGLPIGLSVAGRSFDEVTVLRVAQAYEQATAWHRRRPPI